MQKTKAGRGAGGGACEWPTASTRIHRRELGLVETEAQVASALVAFLPL